MIYPFMKSMIFDADKEAILMKKGFGSVKKID